MTHVASELARLDAVGQAALVRRGEVTPAELVDAALARLERIDAKIHAVVLPDASGARDAARAKDLPDGPLRGVPMLMKDIGGEEGGRPCHRGMRALKDANWIEKESSYLVGKIRAAGMISLGRASTPELALVPTTEPDAYGATRNPWNLARSPGGSSGGSAAAVAAGIVPVAHASDGGGSIRGPASHCGLVGLKPTRGRCSFGPSLGERWSGLSNEFFVTRSVRDVAALLDVVAGAMPGDPYAAAPPARPWTAELAVTPGRLRIGFMTRAPREAEIAPDSADGVRATAALCERLGHAVEERHPAALDEKEHIEHYVKVVMANTARALDAVGEKLGRALGADDVEPLTWALAERGRELRAPEWLATIEHVHGFGRRLARFWQGDGFDLLLTPTMGAPPPEIGFITSTREEPFRGFFRSAPFGVFTLPFNMSGQPAISLPLHWDTGGLPRGVQLVAAHGREDVLVRIAAQLEEAAPWRDCVPPVFG
jgi:amidase